MTQTVFNPTHFCVYSSQPDIQILCDQTWTTPSYNQTEGAKSRGVYLTGDSRWYTFDIEQVTCRDCMNKAGDLYHEIRSRGDVPAFMSPDNANPGILPVPGSVLKALLRYSFDSAPTHADLTNKERSLITEEQYDRLRAWAYTGGGAGTTRVTEGGDSAVLPSERGEGPSPAGDGHDAHSQGL